MEMQNILKNLSLPDGICEYWDVRIESVTKTTISYDDFELINCNIKPSKGAFIRVYNNGKWHYASTTKISDLNEELFSLAQSSVNSKSHEPKEASLKPYNQKAAEDVKIIFKKDRLDEVSISEKKSLCESYFGSIKKFNKLKQIKCTYSDEYKLKGFRSSTDVFFIYDFNQCGYVVSYAVVDGKDHYESYCNLFAASLPELGNQNSKLENEIEESHAFLKAKTVKPGNYPVILDSSVVGVFAHESFGHKSEADFMLGDENAKESWKLGSVVGDSCLSIVDYGGEERISGYCPFDDEGFPTQKTYLIKNGILEGRLHSQHTAQYFHEAPTGNGRAINFEFEPIVRMTNTYVEPGSHSFEDLVSMVDDGFYIKEMRGGSGLSTFTIRPHKVYRIRNGQISEPVRASVLSGSVFTTLKQVKACSKEFAVHNSAFGGCGKGEQFPLPISDGGPKVLISEMMVS